MAASNRLSYLPLFSFPLSFILLSPFFSLAPFVFTLCPLSMPLLSCLAVSLLQYYFILLLFLRKTDSRSLFSRLVSERGNGIGRGQQCHRLFLTAQKREAEPTCRAMASAGVACSNPSMGRQAGLLLAQWQSLGVQHALAVSNHLFLYTRTKDSKDLA